MQEHGRGQLLANIKDQIKDEVCRGYVSEISKSLQREQKKAINNENLEVIVRYLNIHADPSMVIFDLFPTKLLTNLSRAKPKIWDLEDPKFMQTVEAIKLGLSPEYLDHLDLDRLDALANKDCIELISSFPVSELDPVIRVLNFGLDHLKNLVIEELVSDLKAGGIEVYTLVVDRLSYLGITPTTVSLRPWIPINSMPSGWFNPKYKNFIDSNLLDRKIFTPYGIEYILTKIRPKSFDISNLCILKLLLKVFVSGNNLYESSPWEMVSRFFFFEEGNNLQKQKLFKILVTLSSDVDLGKIKPEHLQCLFVNYFITGDHFDLEYFLNHLFLLKLSDQIYSNEGLKLCKRIESLGVEINDDYIEALNKILRDQLQFVGNLESLSDAWLTKEGLQKLAYFNKAFLLPRGLKFISRLSPEEISQEDILIVNRVEQDSLFDFFQDRPLNLSVLVKYAINFLALKKICDSLQETRKQARVSIAETKDLTEELLNGEDAISYQKYIASQESDYPPILLISEERDLTQDPITYEELNDHFCVIRPNPENYASSFLSIRDPNLIGVRLPILNDDVLTESNIFDLDESNIDLITLNAAFSKNPSDHDEQLGRISFIESLFKKSYFVEIPRNILVEELLLQLDLRYFHEVGLFTYLKRFAANEICLEDVTTLNGVADQLFNKFKDHDNIAGVLDSLPAELFDNSKFTPDIFASMPAEWLKESAFIEVLQLQAKNLTPSNFKKGKIMALKFDVEAVNLAHFIREGKTADFFFRNYGSAKEFLERMKDHARNNAFETRMLPSAYSILTKIEEPKHVKDIVELCATDRFDTICWQLYQLALQDSNDKFPKEIFNVLRQKVKSSLMPKKLQLSSALLELEGETNTILKDFSYFLIQFRYHNNLDHEARSLSSVITTVSESRLQALRALQAALDKKETAFVELFRAIENHELDLGFKDSTLYRFVRSVVQQYDIRALCKDFGDKFLEIQKRIVTQIFADCKSDSELLREALLHDLFFEFVILSTKTQSANLTNLCSLITPSQKDDEAAAIRHCDVFFEIMENYRGNVLKEILGQKPTSTDQEEKLRRFNNLYKGYLTRKPSGFPLLPESIRSESTAESNMPSPDMPPLIDDIVDPSPVLPAAKTTHETLLQAKAEVDKPISKSSVENRSRKPILPFSTFGDLHRTFMPNFSLWDNAPTKSYQLLDTDLLAGIYQLRQELLQVNEKNDSPKPNPLVHFFPVWDLNAGQARDGADSFVYLKEAAEAKPGKICFLIMSINTNHWISLFFYNPNNEKDPTQLILLDGMQASSDKGNATAAIVNRLRRELPNWNIRVILEITQQINGDDCGISCLQNAHDLLYKKLITIENCRMVLNGTKLTLNRGVYRGDYRKLTAEIRERWEDRLKLVTDLIVFNMDDTEFPSGAYSLEANKKLQEFKAQGFALLGKIVIKFSHDKCGEIQSVNHYLKDQVPLDQESVIELIDGYIMSQKECDEFFNLCEKIDRLREKYLEKYKEKYQGEYIGFDEKSLKQSLLQEIQIQNRKIKCDDFNSRFKNYLEKNGLLQTKFSSEDLNGYYGQFISIGDHNYEWIAQFESINHWKHFPSVEAFVKKHSKAQPSIQPRRHFSGVAVPHLNNRPANIPSLSIYDIELPPPPLPKKPTEFTIFSGAKGKRDSENGQLPIRLPRKRFPRIKLENPQDLSKQMIDLLNSLVNNLDTYPTLTGFQAFTSVLKEQKLVKEIKDKCTTAWIGWLEQPHNAEEIGQQRYFIAYYLYQIIYAVKGKNSKYEWPSDKHYHGKLIIEPLAKLLGINEEFIKEYNTSKLSERKMKVVEGIATQSNSGYGHLMQEILMEIYKYTNEPDKLVDLSVSLSTIHSQV
jgi:hypothetical protein